jgi:uncharacterized protein
MYIINVLGIPTDPQRVAEDFEPADLGLTDDLEIQGKIWWQAEIYRLGEKIYIRGTVSADVRQICARCLKEMTLGLQAPVQLAAIPAQIEAPAETEGSTENEDGSVISYSHEQLDLAPELRSALILALPMKPLCREDCPGLCPWCGARLADGPHDCRKPPQAGPFSVLAAWPKNRSR